VYVAQSVQGNSQVGVPFAKLYLVGECWLEVEVVFVFFGNAYLKCVFTIEMLGLDSRNRGFEDVNPSGMDRDELVLLKIAKFVQLPKGMVLRRVRSLVRLNSIDLFRNIIRKPTQSLGIVISSAPSIEVLGDREVDVPRRVSSRFGLSQLPCHLVETGPKAVEELPKLHSEDRIEALKLKPFDVSSVIRVVLGDDGVRFFHVGRHMPVESIKVKLCPFRFCHEVPVGPWNHFPHFPKGVA